MNKNSIVAIVLVSVVALMGIAVFLVYQSNANKQKSLEAVLNQKTNTQNPSPLMTLITGLLV